jgi:hypothetical protein
MGGRCDIEVTNFDDLDHNVAKASSFGVPSVHKDSGSDPMAQRHRIGNR